MKLCIVKPDNAVVEISMSDRQPSLEMINNEILFFENYLYKVIIKDSNATENVELFIGDYDVSLHYNAAIDCFETETELIFGGCFDLVYLSVYLDDGNGDEKVFYTDFLRVATAKQTVEQVEKMLREIEENIPNFLEVCFSRSRKNSGIIQNNIRSIWNTLALVDEIIEIYEENYGHFTNHKKAAVESVAMVVDAKSMRIIDQESLRWLASNPDYLVKTDKKSGIVVNDKNYVPSKIKTYLPQYSYDIYENRVVLGFLQKIIDYLSGQISSFNREMAEFRNIPEKIVMQIPNTHALTGRCVYVYYQGVVRRFLERKSHLQDIYYKYEKILKCSPYVICGIPKLTNTFKQVYHYRLCYECIVKWFKAGDYLFDHINYLFKLKTLSRIFEYFCLIKLQIALSECGYKLREANRIVYDMEDDMEDINNQYIFDGNGYELKLLYEPYIRTNKVNEGINLYSTGYNFLKNKWNDKWTPDFVLKLSNGDRDYYFILDAKYSNALNVKKRYMPDLVLKYSAQIASKDSFFSEVIGVGAIYPGDEDKIYYFKKNAIGSRKQSLPQFFSLTIVGGNEGTLLLKDRIRQLLKVIESIEEEKENTEIEKKKTEQKFTLINPNIIHEEKERESKQVGFKEKKDIFGIQNKTFSEHKETYNLQLKDTKIFGKKCFFYAKGLCMCKKNICTIVDDLCNTYVPKNSRELLREESCRNFMHFEKHGKTMRVECSVSGLPGCVGKENCKFYLKKNSKR